MEPLVDVLHFLLAREVKVDESWRSVGLNRGVPYIIRGLSCVLRVEPDTEFPKDVRPPGAVYLRMQGNNAGATSLVFLVHHRNARGVWQELSWIPSRIVHPIPFAENAVEVHDLAVNLPYLRLGSEGLHAISVHSCPVDEIPESRLSQESGIVTGWTEDPEDLFGETGWTFGAADYFWVERST